MFPRVCSNAHGEANDHREQAADNERTALANFVRAVGDDDGEDGSRDVNRNFKVRVSPATNVMISGATLTCHQLGLAALVAQLADNGREEQRDAVKRANDLR